MCTDKDKLKLSNMGFHVRPRLKGFLLLSLLCNTDFNVKSRQEEYRLQSLEKTEDLLAEELKIPENVTITVEGGSIVVKGPKGTLTKNFKLGKLKLEKKPQALVISCEKPRKKDKALFYTTIAHLKNMFQGVTKGWEYELKIVYSHFPIKASTKGNKFIIENFLGEHSPRTATILEGANIEIKGDKVIVTGIDLERVSQTASNIELATRIKDRDPRVFQDGIYIVKKG